MSNDISMATHGKVEWCYGSHYYVYLSAPNKQKRGVALTVDESKALRKALKDAEKRAASPASTRGDT